MSYPPPGQWTLSTHDVAQILGDVSFETVKRWAQNGKIPARKNAFGAWRFNTAHWPDSDPRVA